MNPSIAFVVACRDEQAHIEACLDSLLQQDYPPDLIQVAVVDGGSTDATQAIVHRFAARDPRVKLLDNPKHIAASAFNIGIAATNTELVSLVSAHSVMDPGYARTLVDAFATSGADLVGGRMLAHAAASTSSAEAIERATSSPFGIGDARFHFSEEPGWVDTAFPGAYRRTLLDEIGGFDEALVRNQDDDLHFRAAQRGHRMWFDPRLRSTYRPRTTLGALWRQYFDYGVYRAATVLKHGRFASARHAAPPLLVAGLAAPLPLLAVRWVRRLWLVGVLAYGAFVVAGGLRERAAPLVRVRTAVAIATLHLAYGSGFWIGLTKGLRRE